MHVKVTKSSGLFWRTPRAACGDVIEVPSEEGARLIAAGHAVAVESPPPPVPAAPLAVEVEPAAPFLGAVRNGAYKKGRKK